jgi:rhomboid family GlyGly-CTERM serine protease
MSDHFPRRTPVISRRQGWWLFGLALGALVLLSLGGEPWREVLRFESSAVSRGEYWRLLSGHWVHGSTQHLILNIGGLVLVATLFPRDYSLSQWLFIVAASTLAIDAGFVWFGPQLEWYVGLSGVLHGILAAGAIAWWRHETKRLALALSAILVAKLGWEQLQGPLPLSGDIAVVVNAHLYGAVGGALAGTAVVLRERLWPAERRSL